MSSFSFNHVFLRDGRMLEDISGMYSSLFGSKAQHRYSTFQDDRIPTIAPFLGAYSLIRVVRVNPGYIQCL